MRTLQRLADGIIGRLVPKIDADALWYWQERCFETDCSTGTGWQNRRRYCHDGSGYCQPWENSGCCLAG